MPQIINTNIASLNAQRNLNKSQSANQTSLQRLSSGLRINSAKDDAAGLAISTRFNSQIRGLNVAVRNAGDGISLAQTAEGALGSMNDNLQRVRELAVQSANATNSDVDRDALQAEVSQLIAEVSRTADETDFNGRKLLDGSFSATFQIGANAGQTLDISIAELTADKLGASKSAGVSAQGDANALGNGDLIINGKNISPSTSADDVDSVDLGAASGKAKAAAINRSYDETGVKAFANENIAAGSEMVSSSTSGTIVLNNFEISIQTTTDPGTSRASVVEAINAMSDQTGVTALDSGDDAGGVSLIAEDGRNISLGVDTTNGFGALTLAEVASATGLAVGTAYDTSADTGSFSTYTGGFTLVADGDVGEIVISGGDNTGNGNLANSGLSAGTYDRGVAQVTSTAITDTTSDSIDAGQSFFASEGLVVGAVGSSTGSPSGGIAFNSGNAATMEVLTVSDGQGNSKTIALGTTDAAGSFDVYATNTGGGFGADSIAAAISDFDGVTAFAETKFTLSGADLAAITTGAIDFYDTSSTGVAMGTLTLGTSMTSAEFVDQINNFAGGNLVAQALGTTATADISIVDVSGNTVNMSNFTGTAGDITITASGRDAATTTMDLSSSGHTAGSATVVGYVKDIQVDEEAVKEFSVTSNLAVGLSSVGGSIAMDSTANIDSLSSAVQNSASATITQPLTGLADGDLVLNEVNVGAAAASDDTASSTQASNGDTILSSQKEASGIAVAAAINKIADDTGVKALVNETVVTGGDGSGFDSSGTGAAYRAGDTGQLYINGVDLGQISLKDDGTGTIDELGTRQNTIDLINAKAGQTGVIAEDNGESITLKAEDGRNISVAIDNDDANNVGQGSTFGAQIGLDSANAGIGEADIGTSTTSDSVGDRGVMTEGEAYETTYSKVTLTSAQEINISSGTNGTDEVAALGFTIGDFGGGESGQFLSEIDVSTFEGATAALTAIDNAIGSIASQRADLGAIQNRMESTVSNLAITSENLSAANSRIQDADFAAETAELSRTQVLQQAGISILSQANQGPQQVLSLLG